MFVLILGYMLGFGNTFKTPYFEKFGIEYFLDSKKYTYLNLGADTIENKSFYSGIKSLYFRVKIKNFELIPFFEKAFFSEYDELKDRNYFTGFSLSFENIEGFYLTFAKNFGYFRFKDGIKRDIGLFYLSISNYVNKNNFAINMEMGFNYLKKVLSPSICLNFTISDTSKIKKIKDFVPYLAFGFKIFPFYYIAYAESDHFKVSDDYCGSSFISLSFVKNKYGISYTFSYEPWIKTFEIPGVYYYGVKNKFDILIPFKNFRFGISYSNFNAGKLKEGRKINENEIDIILKII